MQDARWQADVVFGIIDDNNKGEKPKERSMDDLDWCYKNTGTLATDRMK